MSVKAKVLVIVISAVFVMTVINIIETVVDMEYNGKKEIAAFKERNYEQEVKKLESYILLAMKTMEYFDKKEGLSLEEKKKQAFKAVETLRYSKTGYFWINDYNHVVLAHGTKPSLAGKSMYDLQDKKGTYLYREIVKAASGEKRAGLVKYYWPKPGKEGSQPKLSYVAEYKPWNIIVGTGVYIDDLDDQEEAMTTKMHEQEMEVLMIMLMTTLVFLLVIIFVVNIITNKIIISPLKDVEEGLENFFKFLNKQINSVNEIKVNSEDEFGKMSETINTNIKKTITLIQEDEALITEVKRVVNEVNQGDIQNRINVSTSNQTLEELRINLNTMLDSFSKNVSSDITKVTKVLDRFAALDFTQTIDDNGRVAQELNNLSKIISEMLVTNLKTGNTLQHNATQLNENIHTLSISSNETAASLEETAAALEEITANMQNNVNNVNEMSNYANDVIESVSKGQKLASQTVASMDEINDEVEAINEAITIIDQIAFQTNILSLNAAVEAATAGEAGKGFAVVAQEVRNLASRSAEAAKEIKDLVENATIKANGGKDIASNMINGYEQLNESINSTIELIQSVSNSSKEQQVGVSQVNDALNQLDKSTQQNASIASKASQIANETNSMAQEIVNETNKKEFIGK